MATKPTIALARWADQIGANLLVPSSGLRDLGFQASTPAVAGYVNSELSELYKWALYLSDGALTGDHSIGGVAVTLASGAFTADSSTDTLTRAAHGLATGAGPLLVSNSGGALPAGLTAATPYWAIVTGASTFKVATSRAAALGNAWIPITDNGTGTHSIVSSSATSVGHLAVAGSITGEVRQFVDASYGLPATKWVNMTDIGGATAALKASGSGVARWEMNNATTMLQCPLDMPVGSVLSKIRIAYNLAVATNQVVLQFGWRDLVTGTTVDQQAFGDNNGTAYESHDTDQFNDTPSSGLNTGPHVIQSGRAYHLSLAFDRVAGSGTMVFYGAAINPT